MLCGWAGVDLEIDLSRGNIEKFEADLDACRKYIGGRGIGSKMMWDRVPPEVAPFSNQNPLIFGTGVLTGTLCPGANRSILTTRSPQTNHQTYSVFGGFWGPELKQAGYDTLVVWGRSPTPVYISIDGDRIEIRKAQHLWGKDTVETQRLIRQELGSQDVQVICIGPAGENKAMCASIQHAQGASASRAGVGTVMGDKNLKAIAVHGTKDVRIAKPGEFYDLCERLLMNSARQKAWVDDISHNQILGLVRHALYGNLEGDLPQIDSGDLHASFLAEARARRPGCFNCQIGCRQAVGVPSKEYGYLKCMSHYIFWGAFKIERFDFNARAFHLVEKLGMDSVSSAGAAAFAIDLYQHGILSRGDTDGLQLEFGNEDLALLLLEKIARREGIGDVLADGVFEAARRIGRGAEAYAHLSKKLEVPSLSYQLPYYGFTQALADRADCTRLISYVPQHLFKKTREFKDEYTNSDFWPYPREWIQDAMPEFNVAGSDWERMSKMMSRDRDEINLADCTGVCSFWSTFWAYGPIRGAAQAELVSYATGMDIDQGEALHIAARSGALIRAYNAILGLRRKDDTVPEKVFRDPALPTHPPLDRANLDKVVDSYYKLRGWNSDGIPTTANLHQLDLDFVADELRRKGLYAENLPG